MKHLLIAALVLGFVSCKKTSSDTLPPVVTTDSFTVTVNNGYGAGKYKTGDTVHIFSTSYTDAQVFDKWSGSDVSLLNAFEEWHTWFIMPARAVAFTGSVKSITAFTLQYEMIRGRDRMKPVYYYFPAGHKGFVYLLHGSGGNAANVANSFEFKQLYKDLVNNNFGIIITEAEEATTGIDANGDGKLRWGYSPFDSTTNVDYANIKIITDTFYNRGTTNRTKLRYSAGMSNGGAFSASLSALFKYTAGVSYCAPSGAPIAQTSTTPFQFCMARFDNNDNVGPQGNADALANSGTFNSRGICSKYFIKEHSPLYAERFARRGDISVAQSTAVFNELKSKGYLTNKNYFIGYSDAFVTTYQSNPTAFSQLNSLNALQKLFVIEQIDLAVSDHQMYSDYNRVTLKFLNTQCL
ncbi:alpha/beta hydrolase family protein [Ferruginibacter profundus]